jgi:phage terminase large subunit
MTEKERELKELELIGLLEQEKREQIISKLNIFKEPARYKLVHGGRGSGKSQSIASLIVQKAQVQEVKVLCAREIQYSLEESVYALIVETIGKLQYLGWKITKEGIEHQNGSRFIFRGLKDLRAADSVKSMEGIDICWLEEAQNISRQSLKILVPTIRKDGSEIWASWNPETESDPIMELAEKPDAVVVELNWQDNKWFPKVLKKEMEDDFIKNPDEAEHTWNGLPRKQSDNCVFSRTSIRAAMDREATEEGATEVGLDVARFGGDTTQGYKRKGMKIVDHFELSKADTNEVVDRLYMFVQGNTSVSCKIDEGYNPGVVDVAKAKGINVEAVSFGGQASYPELYPNKISEMWFTFPINEAQIPNDLDIMEQMSDRRYKYDNKGRRCIEPKDDYKKRHGGKSPDKIDALLLAFYEQHTSWALL